MSRGISEVAQRRRRWDILDIPQFSEVASGASGKMNKGLPAAHSVKTRAQRAFLLNVRDIRSFSETKWKKNLGDGRAEPRTVYPLLYAPTTERRRTQRGTKRSGVSSKNIFRSHIISDRLSFLIINLIFSVLENERGVRGEFHFPKLLIFILKF